MKSSIRQSAITLTVAANGDPVTTSLATMLAYLCFSSVESMIEKLIWGEHFLHWGDPIFAVIFIGYAVYLTRHCAMYRIALLTEGKEKDYETIHSTSNR